MRGLLVDPDERRVLGVSELVAQLRGVLALEFGELWVEGEIASLHRSRPGHLYFDLKDEDAQLRCAMFRRSAQGLAFDPEDGLRVRVRARLDIYPERGALQLVVEELQPAGEGALRLAFERMKQRLLEEGLFDPSHKRALPFLPARIGLVTSVHGAAIHDFVRSLRRRCQAVELVVYDARVQGEGAWREVVRGLHLLDGDPSIDVIVLTRGGGSLEDLWTFNREELVRAIFELETPLVSAIGHEVDLVLTDLVADARAATPTAAAEVVAPDAEELFRRVGELGQRLSARQAQTLELLRHQLEALRRGLVHPARRLAELERRLVDARTRLRAAALRALQQRASVLASLRQRLRPAATRGQERRTSRLQALGSRLDSLSPLAVLGRGFCLARREADGAILRSSRQVVAGDGVHLRLAEGALRASVTGHAES